MSSIQKKYSISFGVIKGKNQNEIIANNLEILEEFDYIDYNSLSTINSIKEFFLTNFGQRYHYCKCELSLLSLYNKENNSYRLSKISDNPKLSEFKINRFYLIPEKTQCNCEYKNYDKYMSLSKFDLIKKLKNLDDRILQLEKSNAMLLKIDELISENLKLKKEIEKLTKVEELNNYINPKVEDIYDIIIDINSIKNANQEGWKVKFNELGLEKYNKYKDKSLITIGVLGNISKGKSYILSKISKIKLLTGMHTKGISIKYPELSGNNGNQLILIDSEGLENPVFKQLNNEKNENNDYMKTESDIDKEQNEIILDEKCLEDEYEKIKKNYKEFESKKEFNEYALDKIMTEFFLQNLMINISDILLVVVGELTYSEQLLINRIKEVSKKQNEKRILIIHNLKEFRTKEQVENYIKTSLLKCSLFDLNKRTPVNYKKYEEEIIINGIEKKEIIMENNIDDESIDNIHDTSKINNLHFTEVINYGDKKKLEVYHLILANEDSEVGKIYNEYAYNFIENLSNLITEAKTSDIFQQIKDNLKDLSNTFINNNIKEVLFNENEKIIKDKIMKLECKEDLTLKKININELGYSYVKIGRYEPKYNYYKPYDNTLEIRVEIPGYVKCDVTHQVKDDETIITVTGTKIKDKDPKRLEDNLFNIREFSEFELNIPLKTEEFQINQTRPKNGYPKFKNGICIIQYELAEKGETIKAQTDDD